MEGQMRQKRARRQLRGRWCRRCAIYPLSALSPLCNNSSSPRCEECEISGPNATELNLARGKPVKQVAEALCVRSKILYSWRRRHLPQGTRGGGEGGRGPIFHIDRGSQYGSGAIHQRLQDHKPTPSVSAWAHPYHRA